MDTHIALVTTAAVVRQVGQRRLHIGRLETPPDQALGPIDRVGRIGDRLTFGQMPDQPFAALGHRHDRWRGVLTGAGEQYPSFVVLKHRHTRVGGSKIDANHFTHDAIRLPLLGLTQGLAPIQRLAHRPRSDVWRGSLFLFR